MIMIRVGNCTKHSYVKISIISVITTKSFKTKSLPVCFILCVFEFKPFINENRKMINRSLGLLQFKLKKYTVSNNWGFVY